MQEPMSSDDLLSAAQSTLPPVEPSSEHSAGQLLRQAREAAQMHMEFLAGTLKVPVRRIQALEEDDWAALPDAAFTRALASSICRQLKIAPEPILALLPAVRQQAPDEPNTLAHDKALMGMHRKSPAAGSAWHRIWRLVLLLTIVAVGLGWYFSARPTQSVEAVAEQTTLDMTRAHERPQANVGEGATGGDPPLAHAVGSVVATLPAQVTPLPIVTTLPSLTTDAATGLPLAESSPNPTAPSAATQSGGVLRLQATAECWVKVLDAEKKVQLSRLLRAGEGVSIQGAAPYQIWTGRAEALVLIWQGRALSVFAGKTGSQRTVLPMVPSSHQAAPIATVDSTAAMSER